MPEETEYAECNAQPEKEDTCEECGMLLKKEDFIREITPCEEGRNVRTIIGYECHYCGHWGDS